MDSTPNSTSRLGHLAGWGLVLLAVDVVHDDLGSRDGQFEALTTHRLDEHGELRLDDRLRVDETLRSWSALRGGGVDGAYVDEFYLGGDDKIDMFLYSSEGTAQTLANLADLPIHTPRGAVVPLSAIGETVSDAGTDLRRQYATRETRQRLHQRISCRRGHRLWTDAG